MRPAYHDCVHLHGGTADTCGLVGSAGRCATSTHRRGSFSRHRHPHDLLQSCQSGDKLYERIDATLVEKAMGSPELYLALELSWRLRTYLQTHDLGFLYAPDALMALRTDLIRSPDVSFVPWTRRPERTVSTDPISREIPALVVEILSPGNTEGEMQRKIAEYHDAGVAVVWVIDSSFLGRGYPVPRGTVGI